MTFKEKWELDHPGEKFSLTGHGTEAWRGPSKCGYEKVDADSAHCEMGCTACWNREMPGAEDRPHILDSGERQQFETGAVRDSRGINGEPKGRCDLMPLRVLARIWRTFDTAVEHTGVDKSKVFDNIADFQDSGDTRNLELAIHHFVGYLDYPTAFLEVAKHFEEGAKKYGESNWQKGIPVRYYIDSALRHYIKWLRGDKDEPHDRAFVWNLLCCIWEVDFSPRAKMKGTPVAEELPDPEANSGRFYICNRTPCETCHSDCHCTEYRGEAAVLELCDRDVRYDECPVGLFMTDADGVFLKTEIINAETGLNTAVHIGLGLSRKFEADTVVTPIKYPFKERERE